MHHGRGLFRAEIDEIDLVTTLPHFYRKVRAATTHWRDSAN